jgi:hypothetical protein
MTYGGTPWTSDQLVARPVPTQDNATQKDQRQMSMPQAGFLLAIRSTRAKGPRFRRRGHWDDPKQTNIRTRRHCTGIQTTILEPLFMRACRAPLVRHYFIMKSKAVKCGVEYSTYSAVYQVLRELYEAHSVGIPRKQKQ